MTSTPRNERIHIGIFGRRNAGKSSLINALSNQDVSVVSPVKGTTTDPVYKSMELLPIGPVVLIDTPGIDDIGELGEQRVKKTRAILRKTDIAILVVGVDCKMNDDDNQLVEMFEGAGIGYVIVNNVSSQDSSTFCATSHALVAEIDWHEKSKTELSTLPQRAAISQKNLPTIYVNADTKSNIETLKAAVVAISGTSTITIPIVSDLLTARACDVVVLVTPIDEAAPKGRLILPQQQVIRDILDVNCIPVLTQVDSLPATISSLRHAPKMVITDSQVFGEVAQIVPESIPLTSFSILMARYKGVLSDAVKGAKSIDTIKDGDNILISEGCTHHRQCDDIGTVKIPRMIEKHTGAKPVYTFSSGGEFPDDLSKFALVIHCGGCMLNAREMMYRNQFAKSLDIPMTNYGVVISHMQGILERCVAPFGIS